MYLNGFNIAWKLVRIMNKVFSDSQVLNYCLINAIGTHYWFVFLQTNLHPRHPVPFSLNYKPPGVLKKRAITKKRKISLNITEIDLLYWSTYIINTTDRRTNMQHASVHDQMTAAGLLIGKLSSVPKGMRELTDCEHKICEELCALKAGIPVTQQGTAILIVTQGIHTPTNKGRSLFWAIVQLITEPDSINLNDIINDYLQHDDTNAILYTAVLERIQHCVKTCTVLTEL